jgi:hypothetical protein
MLEARELSPRYKSENRIDLPPNSPRSPRLKSGPWSEHAEAKAKRGANKAVVQEFDGVLDMNAETAPLAPPPKKRPMLTQSTQETEVNEDGRRLTQSKTQATASGTVDPKQKMSLVQVVREVIRREEVDNILSGTMGVRERGVKVPLLVKCLQQRKEKRDSCMSLPMTILFFIVFVNSTQSHSRVYEVHGQQAALRNIIENSAFDHGHKTIFDINDYWDWWTWMDESFAPYFMQQKDEVTQEPWPDSKWGRVIKYSQVVGGIRIEQVRSRATPCTKVDPSLNLTCLFATNPDDFSGDPFGRHPFADIADAPPDAVAAFAAGPRRLTTEDTGELWEGAPGWTDIPFGRRLRAGASAKDGEVLGRAKEVTAGAPLFQILMLERTPVEENMAKLHFMRDNHWLDPETFYVQIRMILLNPEFSTPFYHVSEIRFVFTRGGYITKRVDFQSIPVMPYASYMMVFYDLLFLGLVLMVFFQEFKEVLNCLKEGTLFNEYLIDGWNLLDWFTIFCGFVLMGLWLWCSYFIVELNKMVGAYGRSGQQDPDLARAVHDAAPILKSGLMYLQIGCSYYTLVIMARFFKAFRAQPRLAIVTTTLYNASSDIGHFMLVFLTIILSYGMAGVFLFGRANPEFMNLEFAMMTCFRAMMGDFDWDELSRQHRGSAFFWFCSYMVLVYLIMLNMLLAIVMDVYTGVKAKMSSKESDAVWTQTWIMMKGFYMKMTNRDKTVSDERILEKLQGVVKIVPALDKKGLLELIPNLQPDQAQDLLNLAEHFVEEENEQMVSMSNALKIMGAIKITVDKIEEQVCGQTADDSRPGKKKRKYQLVIEKILYYHRTGKLRKLGMRLDEAQSPKSMALSNIPPIYRKMVNRVIQRELNVQFCILQEEIRQDLAHIRSDGQDWQKELDVTLRGLRTQMADTLARLKTAGAAPAPAPAGPKNGKPEAAKRPKRLPDERGQFVRRSQSRGSNASVEPTLPGGL